MANSESGFTFGGGSFGGGGASRSFGESVGRILIIEER
jgi:hypothetical protein